jgi:predicted RND superfamily exporter protein
VLADLRRLTGPDTLDELSAEDRADVERLRPPADLKAIRAHDIPEALAPQFVENDGSRGKLVYADQASRFNGWNGRHMEVFAGAVRRLHFPDGTHLGGGPFVFADILRAVSRDGPRATLAALLAVLVMVVVVVGPNRYGLATLAASLAGTSAMLACAWLLGVKVNFLDFAALPITLGISVDYAANVVARQRGDVADSARHALATTGGAVVLCSWTTIVGYGSLLLSANAGIRSFGMVAVVGELTCLAAALTVAPAVLDVLTPRARAAVG